jgi:GNAT superfamily N-acetyltransferase
VNKPNATQIRYESIRVSELPEFAKRSMVTESGGVQPITPQRAQSQSMNPAAESEDDGLFLAYDDNQVVGYLAIVPGWLSQQDKKQKIYWASSLFISPTHRGLGIAESLYNKAFTKGYDVLAIEMTEPARHLYMKMKAKTLGSLQYYSIDFRRTLFLFYGLSLINKLKKRIPVFLPTLHRLVHRLFRSRLRNLWQKMESQYSKDLSLSPAEPIARIPQEFTAKTNSARFERYPVITNWMLEYPWVVQNSSQTENSNYHFSDKRALFKYLTFKLSSEKGTQSAFLVLSVSTIGNVRTLKNY